MYLRPIIIAISLISTVHFSAQAQRDGRSMESGVTSVVNNDSNDNSHVEKAFKDNSPQSPKENSLPRFAIVGKDKEFYLGIGAQLLGEGVFTWGDDMPSATSFTPSALTPATPGNGSKTQFAWQTSSIYLNFVAMPETVNRIGLFFKGNFTGNNNSFSCYHFYGKYRGLTVGYTNSAFTDAAAEPMTIDFGGPNGYPYLTLFTAYWQQSFTKHLSGAIGIDEPTAAMTCDGNTTQVNQRIPAIPLYLQYAWADGSSHVRISGIVRPMQYRDLESENNRLVTGWGVQFSGMSGVAGGLSLNFNAAYGKGIGSYLQDDNGLGLDAVPYSTPGRMKTVGTLGLTGGISYAFSSKVSTNLTYSHLVNHFPEGTDLPKDTYKYGDYVAANVIWNINKFVSAGIEYDYGHRKNLAGEGLHANRLQCQIALTL